MALLLMGGMLEEKQRLQRTCSEQQKQLAGLRQDHAWLLDRLKSATAPADKGAATQKDRGEVASLDRIAAAYDAKAAAQQEQVDALQNTIVVCKCKAAEAKQELALASDGKPGSVKAEMARKQLEDRTAVLQQRLNTTLAQNAQLHAGIEEHRRKILGMREKHAELSECCEGVTTEAEYLLHSAKSAEAERDTCTAECAALTAERDKEQVANAEQLQKLDRLDGLQRRLQALQHSKQQSAHCVTADPPDSQSVALALQCIAEKLNVDDEASAAQALVRQQAANSKLFREVSAIDAAIAEQKEQGPQSEVATHPLSALDQDAVCALQKRLESMEQRTAACVLDHERRSSLLLQACKTMGLDGSASDLEGLWQCLGDMEERLRNRCM